jgi:hypothetical protein
MQRYKQRFTGAFAQLVKSDFGDWGKYEDFKTLQKQIEDSFFNVIRKRNEEIAYLQKTCQELGDDLEDSKLWNTKLFSLLVMSTVFNFGAIAFFVFERIGMI